MSSWIWWVIGALVLGKLLSKKEDKKKTEIVVADIKIETSQKEDNLEVVEFDDVAEDGEVELYIAGISYRNLKPSHIGRSDKFKIAADPDNEYDDSAVKIFKGRKHVGFIEREENGDWFDLLEDSEDGFIECRGFIGTFEDEDGVVKFYGKIFLPDNLLES